MLTIKEISQKTNLTKQTIRDRIWELKIKPKGKIKKENLFTPTDMLRVVNKKRKPYGDGIRKQEIKDKADYSKVIFHYENTTERRRYVLSKELKLPLNRVNEILDDHLSIKEPKEEFIILESKMNNNPNL